MIDVNGLFFAVTGIAFYILPEWHTFLGFILAGSLMVNFREAAKWKEIISVLLKRKDS